MNKIISLLFCSLLSYSNAYPQTISIAAARALPVGNTVTISGIVLNGSELGTIRYVQDGTGGIGVYSIGFTGTNMGDLVSVTGVTYDYFNLLELNPVTSWNLISSGNALPQPAVITPAQLSEPFESHLVQINNVTFSNPGGSFSGNASFGFSANGQPGVIYLRSNSPVVGMTIPLGNVTLTGICSQNNAAYQVLPRDQNDIASSGSISITVPPSQFNITTNSFDVNWQTNIPGSSYIEYGSGPALGNTLTGAGGTMNHSVSVTGLNPSQVLYLKVFSVGGNDTAFSDTKIFITASGSGGAIKAYFNRTVDHSVASSSSNYAVRLNYTIDDTLKAYIDRCQSTLDIAIYSFDVTNTGNIISAINDAYARGVQVRIISEGGNNNTGLALLNGNIPIVSSPTGISYGIMHNKFVILDADASNPDVPVVWTGSTNWSNNQLYVDANNVIIFQDKSLAVAYTMEFNEMWGSAGAQPNAANAKFGQFKSDNTPHEFLIGGKRVENYFSPSDNVNNRIIKTVQTADAQLFFATFVFTRYDVAFAIEDRIGHGVLIAGIFDDTSSGGSYPFSILQTVMGGKLLLYDHPGLPGILHHKYMIIDQNNASWDPLVLTGSHNWSTSANQKNDENTVIVHDADIANQYYQEFYSRFTESGGTLGVVENSRSEKFSYLLYPNPAHDQLHISFDTQLNAKWNITVTDISGKVISKNKFESHQSNHLYQLDIKDYIPGVYLIFIDAGGLKRAGKFIVK